MPAVSDVSSISPSHHYFRCFFFLLLFTSVPLRLFFFMFMYKIDFFFAALFLLTYLRVIVYEEAKFRSSIKQFHTVSAILFCRVSLCNGKQLLLYCYRHPLLCIGISYWINIHSMFSKCEWSSFYGFCYSFSRVFSPVRC